MKATPCKTSLYFKDVNGTLRNISFESNDINIAAVQNQSKLKTELFAADLSPRHKSPVLCLIIPKIGKAGKA